MSHVPLEIWYEVFDHFDRSELKALRFISRDFNRGCIQKIFGTVYLGPFSSSVRNAWFLARTPDLARCVLRIVVKEEQIAIVHSLYSFKNRIEALYMPREAEDHICNRLIRNEESYRQDMSRLNYESWMPDGDEEVPMLCGLISLFPNLRHLARWQSKYTENLIEYRDEDPRLHHVYRMRLRELPAVILPVESISAVGLMRPLRSLDLYPIDTQELVEFGALLESWLPAETLPSLSALRLGLYSREIHFRAEDDELKMKNSFEALFAAAPNIEKLSLQLLHPELVTHGTMAEQETTIKAIKASIMASLLQQHQSLQALQQLSLRAIVCNEIDLVAFARSHADKLQSLALEDITFLSTGNTTAARNHRPSFMSLCLNLRDQCALSHFYIGGTLGLPPPRGMDVPTFTLRAKCSSSLDFLNRLCESVCDRSEFPLMTVGPASGIIREDQAEYHYLEDMFISIMQDS